MDVNQTGRGVRGGGITLDRATEDRLADEAALYPGSRFGDIGHFEARNKAHALTMQNTFNPTSHVHGADSRVQEILNSMHPIGTQSRIIDPETMAP